ncbi:MAG: hypothetical protein LBC73_08025 [Oscillospiraceae bacterium]|jgi:multiple sugar transport system substrate-binding protein|nr:hypothetical protein [Oscillospiraceae bacterium]
MKINKHYYFSLILLVLIIAVVMVASCDNNEEQDDVIPHVNLIDEYIFLAQDGYNILDIGTARMINGLLIHDELIYYIFVELIYISEEDDTYYQIIQIRGVDIHGNISNSISIPISELIHIDVLGFNIDQNGELIIIVQEYDEGRVRSSLNYERYNLAGEILHREELFTIGNRYWVGAHFSENGYIAVIEFSLQNGSSVHIWDDTLTLINNIPLFSYTFAFGTDGVILSRAEDDMTIQIIDISTGKVLEEHSFLLDNYITGIYVADETSRFDYFIHTERHLYGFILDEEELNHILDFFESNLNLRAADFRMTFGSEDKVVIAQNRSPRGLFDFDTEIELSVLRPVDRAVLEKNDRIVLAGFGLQNFILIENVMDYNRRNPFQQIIIRDYYDLNNDIDYEQSIVRFHLDLLTGAAPDIIWIDYSRSIDFAELIDSLIMQGYFSNLYDFIDSDQTLNREDFFPNILKGYEDRNGLLPVIGNRFLLKTMISVDPSITEETWSVNEFFKVMDNTINLGNTEPIGGLTGVDFVLTMVELMSDEFIDFDTGNCYFDSEIFIRLLELAKITSANPDPNNIFNIEPNFNQLTSGRQIVDIIQFFGLTGWIDGHREGMPKDFNYNFIGAPGANGGKHLVHFPGTFSIFENSQNKDAAWQFVREILLPDATYTGMKYLTLRIDDFEAHLNSALISADKKTDLWNMVNSATVFKEINGTLLALITESVEDYLNGLQTAERTAEIIQSRVSIYLSERN